MTNEEIINKYGEWPGKPSILRAMDEARAAERAKLLSRVVDIITFEKYTKAEIEGEQKTVVGKTSILRQIKSLKL